MPEAKKFLDYAGLQTFLNNLKYNYAQGNTGYVVGKAAALDSARNVALTGDVTGSTTWDGSGALSIATTVNSSFANTIESISVNGSTVTPDANKNVEITVPAATVTDVQTKTASDGSYATVLDGTVAKIDLSGYALKSDITSVLDFKGTKADQASLPASGNKTGDVWAVSADNSEYVWTGSAWEKLGPTIDLSGYVQTTRTINSKALSSDITLDGSDIALSTNYAVASTAAAPAAGDSIDVAVGKLQKEVADANAAATTYAFAEGSTDGAFQVTPTVGGVAGSAQSVAIHGLGSAAYADTTDFVDISLEPAEAGAEVNDIVSITVNGAAVTPDANRNVEITIPAATVTDVQVKDNGDNAFSTVLDGTVAKVDLSGYALSTDLPTVATAIANGDTGYATGDQVYDYFDAHKADGNVIEVVKFKGNGDASASALTVDSSDKSVTVDVSGYALSTDLPTQASAVADGDTGYTTGDQVYDYIDGMAIPDATINALFPANPS